MGSATLKGNDIARLMHKDELAFLHMHHRSYISKSHLSEAERSWNHHHGPVLPNINTRKRGRDEEREREGYTHAAATACSFFCFFYEKHLYLGSLIARDVFHPLISMHCEIKIHPSSFYRPGPENEVKMKKMNSFPWSVIQTSRITSILVPFRKSDLGTIHKRFEYALFEYALFVHNMSAKATHGFEAQNVCHNHSAAGIFLKPCRMKRRSNLACTIKEQCQWTALIRTRLLILIISSSLKRNSSG